jgi:hypothetical protein
MPRRKACLNGGDGGAAGGYRCLSYVACKSKFEGCVLRDPWVWKDLTPLCLIYLSISLYSVTQPGAYLRSAGNLCTPPHPSLVNTFVVCSWRSKRGGYWQSLLKLRYVILSSRGGPWGILRAVTTKKLSTHRQNDRNTHVALVKAHRRGRDVFGAGR